MLQPREEICMNSEEKLELLEKLLSNSNFSKSEVRVYYYCYKSFRNSKDIVKYLKWASPNVARLLLTMTNKNLLNREYDKIDNKTFIYSSNLEII